MLIITFMFRSFLSNKAARNSLWVVRFHIHYFLNVHFTLCTHTCAHAHKRTCMHTECAPLSDTGVCMHIHVSAHTQSHYLYLTLGKSGFMAQSSSLAHSLSMRNLPTEIL